MSGNHWRRLERAVDRIERKAWGETVRLSFLISATQSPDPERPQWEGRAILHAGGDDSRGVDAGGGSNYRTRLAAGEAELVLTRDEYDGPNPAVPNTRKVYVRALDRDGQPRWEVKGVSDRYSNLWVLSLTQA